MLEPLVNKVHNKVVGWKIKLLSQEGRLIILKYVPTCMSSQMVAALDVSNVVFTKLNSIIAIFLGVKLMLKSKLSGGLGLKCANR